MSDLQKADRKRGRPSKANTAVAEEQRAKKESGARKERRVTMARAKKLDIRIKEGYVGRWANGGKPGRIELLQEAGYEFVVDAEGNQITRPSGAHKVYLMQIPKEWYDEDFADGQKLISDIVEKDVQQLRKDEYIPDGQRTALAPDKDVI